MATKQYQNTDRSSYHSVTLDSDNEINEYAEMIPKDLRSTATASNKSYNESDAEYDALMAGQTDKSSDHTRKDIKWNTKHIMKIVLGAGIGSLLEFYSFGLVAYFEPGIII